MATKKTTEKVVIAEGATLAELDKAAATYGLASLEMREASQAAAEATKRVEAANEALRKARENLLEVASRQ
jgi:hypothetical protein